MALNNDLSAMGLDTDTIKTLGKYVEHKKEERERKNASARKWGMNHREYTRANSKKWCENNPEKHNAAGRKWRNDHPEYINEYVKRRRKVDSTFKLSQYMSVYIGRSLKDGKNGAHWENLVGYTVDELVEHLKASIPKGYTWQSFLSGELGIDHIVPKRAFAFKSAEDPEFKECWSLYNLRLLSPKGNSIKHDKITNPVILGLLIKNGGA